MKIQAIYKGRRTTTDNKACYLWLFLSADTGDVEKLYMKQLAPAIVGEKYELTLSDNGSVFTGGENRPKPISVQLDPRHIEWSALDTIAKEECDNIKAMKKLDKLNNEFERRLAPLKQMFDTLQYHDDRHQFVSKITKELWRR
jgi:hypothetical protein